MTQSQTLALVKHLSRIADRITSRLDKAVEAICEQAAAKQHHNEPPPPVVIAELKLPPEITESYHTKQHQESRRENLRTGLEFLVLLFVIATAYFTCLQWNEMAKQTVAMNGQVRVAAQQLKEMRDEFRIDQQPSVSITKVDFVNDKLPVIGKVMMIYADVENGGRSTARKFRGHIHIETGSGALSRVGKYGKFPTEEGFSIPANGKSGFTATGGNHDSDRGPFKPWDGSYPIITWGEFEYFDRDGERLTVSYCREYVAIGSTYFFANCQTEK